MELRNRGKFLGRVQYKWKTKRIKWHRELRKRKNMIIGNNRLCIVLSVMQVTVFSVRVGTANTCSRLQPLVICFCDTSNICMSPVWNLNTKSMTVLWLISLRHEFKFQTELPIRFVLCVLSFMSRTTLVVSENIERWMGAWLVKEKLKGIGKETLAA
jgi:hypothetical protein